MKTSAPRRPQGENNEAVFAKAVWDSLFTGQRAARPAPFQTRTVFQELLPFEIYSCPDDTEAASDWRKFRIHAGYVSVDFADPVLVTGTDGDASPASILADDATAKFWFWVDLSTPATPTIGSGADPQTWSNSKLPIGYVNTETEYAATLGLQMITTNIFACP